MGEFSEIHQIIIVIVLAIFAIDSLIFVFGSVALAFYSTWKQWDPSRTRKYAFWGLLQIFVVMGVLVLLVIPPWTSALLLGGFMLFMFAMARDLSSRAMANREKVYGKEYWKRPGTRGKYYLFLYKDKIQALNEQETILESDPENAVALRKKAELLKELGEEEEAGRCLAKLEQLGKAR